MAIVKVPCCLVRGGTSKGVFIEEGNLPADPAERDKLLVSLFGSPDLRQIDGLGGADPLTSKLAIVAKSRRPGVDVEFLAADVGIRDGVVNYGNMCGNTASGVGYFALDQGLVEAVEPVTEVRIFCRNNNGMLISRIPVRDGVPVVEGDFRIDGVPGTGAPMLLEMKDPGGAVTGRLLPTGRPLNRLSVGNREFDVSLVDSGILYAFLQADEVGISGYELPDELDRAVEFREFMEKTRGVIAELLNGEYLPGDVRLPVGKIKIAVVAPPAAYTTMSGGKVARDDIDIVARIINPHKVHKAYAVSGAICLASAAVIDGTIPNRFVDLNSSPAHVRIGHPTGVIDTNVSFRNTDTGHSILGAEIKRTARILMKGVAYVRV